MKTKLIIIILLITSNIFGQGLKDSETQVHQYIGFAGGSTTGWGISYRYIENKYGFQANLFGGYERNKQANLDIGGTLLYQVDEAANNNLYLYYSNMLYYYNDMQYNQNPITGQYISNKSLMWNTGVGFDIEFNTSRQIVFNLMLGFGAYDSFKMVTLAGEIGVHYRFQ